MSTEIVPLALVTLLIACIYYPIIIGWIALGVFTWGVLAVFIPCLRV